MNRLFWLPLFFPLLGAGWSTTDRSISAMGAGGTGAARATDSGAAIYNPAAAPLGLNVGVGLILAAPQLSAQGTGLDVQTTSGLSTPPFAHAVFAAERWSVGASFSVPFGSNVAWPDDWARRTELMTARVRVYRTTGFAGLRLGRFSLAAGPMVDAGQLSLTRGLEFFEAQGTVAIDTRATGFGAHASVFVAVLPTLDLGLSWQSRTRLNFAGYADFSAPPEFSGRASDSAVNAAVRLPDRLTLGGQWRPLDRWAFDLDLELLAWNTIDRLTLDFEAENTADVTIPRDWKLTVTPRLGATWSPWEALRVRGGFYLDPSPVPAETVGPGAPDSLRVGLTTGAGYQFSPYFSADAAYQLVIFTGQKDTTNTQYSGLAHFVGAQVSVHLPR